MIDSLDLRHFPQSDPPNRLTNNAAHAKIQAQIDEFIASGGEVVELSSDDYDKNPITISQRQKKFLR